MQIAEQTEDRLVVTHGALWVLPVFGLLSAALAWGLAFIVSRLGWANEPASYTALALVVCLYVVGTTRLTRFTFDRPTRTLAWRRRGVFPVSGTIPFDQIEKPVLDARTDRRGTAYYRVALALGRDRALPVVAGRTRDLFACLDVLDGVSAMLGQPTLAAHLRAGETAEAVRLAENRYGAPREKVEVYLERRARRGFDADPSCTA